jgi:two-component system, cell cycle response regulator DivK
MESKPSILVVDDYADGREMVAEYLAYHGFPVREARDGQEAIELAASWRPNVILMDLQMPGMDGWEVTRRLKADPDTKEILVVAVTAHALRREVQAARAAGCDAVVSKPYVLALLADALLRTLEVGPAAFDTPGLGASAAGASPAPAPGAPPLIKPST